MTHMNFVSNQIRRVRSEAWRCIGRRERNRPQKRSRIWQRNDCFGEIEYESLTQEMKDLELQLLMLMVTKRSVNFKTSGCANVNLQRLHADKNEWSSLTPEFCSLKHACSTISKEGRELATMDVPGFFPQTEQEKDDAVLSKLTGSIALSLVESKPEKRNKHLQRKNGK